MDLSTVHQTILERLNRYRRLHSLITSNSFQKLFDASQDQDTVLKLIDAGDLCALEIWVRNEKRLHLELMSVADLRLECRIYGIPNYHLLQKEEMIERIKQERTLAK